MKKYLRLALLIGFWSCGDKIENEIEIEVPPQPVDLYQETETVLMWSANKDDSFTKYNLYGSNDSSMTDKTLIYETEIRFDTTYVLDSSEFFYFFQVDITNQNEDLASSNIFNAFFEIFGELCSRYTTELNLYNKNLTGTIPSEIGNLINLTRLDLTYNQLTGNIPSEIGNLTNLTFFSLKDNAFAGPIPSEVGNLTKLNVLRLANNQLNGEVPITMCDLNINWWSSNSFQIWGNQLCPPYPSCLLNPDGNDHLGDQDTTNCD